MVELAWERMAEIWGHYYIEAKRFFCISRRPDFVVTPYYMKVFFFNHERNTTELHTHLSTGAHIVRQIPFSLTVPLGGKLCALPRHKQRQPDPSSCTQWASHCAWLAIWPSAPTFSARRAEHGRRTGSAWTTSGRPWVHRLLVLSVSRRRGELAASWWQRGWKRWRKCVQAWSTGGRAQRQ